MNILFELDRELFELRQMYEDNVTLAGVRFNELNAQDFRSPGELDMTKEQFKIYAWAVLNQAKELAPAYDKVGIHLMPKVIGIQNRFGEILDDYLPDPPTEIVV